MRLLLLVLCVALGLAAPAVAEPVHGRLQLQEVYASADDQSLAAAFGAARSNDALADLRLSWSPRWHGFALDTAWLIGVEAGRGAGYDTLDAVGIAPPATWWDLTDRFENQPHLVASQRIDRLALSYTTTHTVLRFGRQALSWGAGLVFRPMDLFDPFSPVATDTEYKPGADMLYGQYLFDDGSDVQAVIIPRAPRDGAGLSANASSFALHYHAALGDLQTTWLLARDHGDVTTGINLSGNLGGASWNVEAVPTFLRAGGTKLSALANISAADTLFGDDVTWFVEAYRNGFGVARRHYAIADLPPALLERLARAQVFDSGRDYLAAGMQLQATALVQVSPTLIANLDDRSLYALGEVSWSLSDNLTANFGVQLPIGPHGSEFGGVPLAGSVAPFFEAPARAYVQLRRYF